LRQEQAAEVGSGERESAVAAMGGDFLPFQATSKNESVYEARS
jgi:hypothetical protein